LRTWHANAIEEDEKVIMIELVDAGGIRCNMKRGSVMTSNHGLINSLAVSDATFLLPFVMFIVCLF